MFNLRKPSRVEKTLADPLSLRVQAAAIRTRLLKGVPADSTFRSIVIQMSDHEIVRRDHDHQEDVALRRLYIESKKKAPKNTEKQQFAHLVTAAMASGD